MWLTTTARDDIFEDNNDDARRLGFSRFQYGILFFILFHFTAYMLACRIHHHNHPNKRTIQMEKSPQRRSSTTCMHYSRFFSFDDDGQPRTTATPHSRSFWNNKWCLFIYLFFFPPLGSCFFFLCYSVTIAIYLRLHETKGNLKIKPR